MSETTAEFCKRASDKELVEQISLTQARVQAQYAIPGKKWVREALEASLKKLRSEQRLRANAEAV
jgi:hypothetical protein